MTQPFNKVFDIVVAAGSSTRGIGYKNGIAWPEIRRDMQHFFHITCGEYTSFSSKEQEDDIIYNAVIMGYNTWTSIPFKVKPLRGRLNIIITGNHTEDEILKDMLEKHHKYVIIVPSFEVALSIASYRCNKIFVIGGAQVYNLALKHPNLENIYYTEIDDTVESNTFDAYTKPDSHLFPFDTYIDPIDESKFKLVSSGDTITENNVKYKFLRYTRIQSSEDSSEEKKKPELTINVITEKNVVKRNGNRNMLIKKLASKITDEKYDEQQYLDLIKKIIDEGVKKSDRTGTGTIGIFVSQMRFDLRKGIPMLTTKKISFKNVLEELLWIISGSSDTTVLAKKGVHIWDSDTTKAKLISRGFPDRMEGDLGCGSYGPQMRRFGGKYIDCKTDYKLLPESERGVDQLLNVINLIKRDPYNRRILITLWNPMEVNDATLPPCHGIAIQFYVTPENGKPKYLSCSMYQRSVDCMLGLPYNLVSYSILTYMIAQVCDLIPKEFIISTGDTHIYNNHLDLVGEQLKREIYAPPQLLLDSNVKDIDDFKYEHFKLVNYKAHANIRYPLST